ncbi:uncharacterized protein BO97DRAFT_420158 [Aspergillus homomorphus CBS 101889]|uniref:Uncharacterized protein n=1 Tax=Aspergillus homomorphus (strain CBS 101889) TaxID=1450537 RepID=A0A395IF15_ASPHC|nr:hypothetical protein BO97DRAFT_420158 [Aspergillus homomorphus CBS 101889]RAL16764.1 hypothetical protein BO97DRAFT_420158 [Aspergillus homomorphus CBS 101889]
MIRFLTLMDKADYAAKVAQTARWPEDLQISGKRIAVLGNGSSEMQCIGALQSAVDTPNLDFLRVVINGFELKQAYVVLNIMDEQHTILKSQYMYVAGMRGIQDTLDSGPAEILSMAHLRQPPEPRKSSAQNISLEVGLLILQELKLSLDVLKGHEVFS